MNLQIGTEKEVVRWLRAHGFKLSEIVKVVWDIPSGLRRKLALNPRKKATRKKAAPNSRKQYQYRAKVHRGNDRKSVDFWAISDRVASSYCAGLLMQKLPKGSTVTSLQRTGKSRVGPAKQKKK